MDLVSSTLDRYLKHRFNCSGMNKVDATPKIGGEPKSDNISASNGIDSGDNHKADLESYQESDDCSLPSVLHHLYVSNLIPCCFALEENLRFMALGFENSHIHLCRLSTRTSTETLEDSSDKRTNETDIKPPDTVQAEPSPQTNYVNIGPSTLSSIVIEETSRLLAHFGPVYCIEFIRNDDLMLSCSEDTTIRLWCLKTKCNLAIYRGHNLPIWSLKIGPNGNYFASVSMDATARLWRFDKITPLRIFCGHDGDVECVDFHPNSKYIATGSSDSTVRLWSTSDAKMVRLMIGHRQSIISLSFMPNGKFLASADSEGSIKIWNLATNDAISEMSVPASQTISFNPEQSFVSTCGRDNVLRIWEIDKSKIAEKKKVDFSNQPIKLTTSKFHNDSLFVISFIAGDEVRQPLDSGQQEKHVSIIS